LRQLAGIIKVDFNRDVVLVQKGVNPVLDKDLVHFKAVGSPVRPEVEKGFFILGRGGLQTFVV